MNTVSERELGLGSKEGLHVLEGGLRAVFEWMVGWSSRDRFMVGANERIRRRGLWPE